MSQLCPGCSTGMYPYTEDLLNLDRVGARAPKARSGMLAVIIPLVLPHWESMLADHPDKDYVGYLLKGIERGFRIGFDRGGKLVSARKNMLSAVEHPEVVAEYLLKEKERGVLLGPFQRSDVPEVVISRFGVIPKGGQPGKWRLIVDLSHPDQRSVNDGVRPEWCSLTYVRVEDVVRRLLQLGVGAKMAKIDIKSAYRIVPVHPDDRHLLGMCWDNQIYVDAVLPFGLRSAPKIFNAVADALEWMVRRQGVRDIWHYLDDYIVCGAPGLSDCADSLQMLIEMCRYLGIPLAEEKVEGPSTCLTFLGIEIDTVTEEVRLPSRKVGELGELLGGWLDRKRCTKRELLSIAGKLQHAATVVRSGRTFVRRLFDLSARVKKPEHHIKLNAGARSDLAWWAEFLKNMEWNLNDAVTGQSGGRQGTDFGCIRLGLWSLLGGEMVPVGLGQHWSGRERKHCNQGTNSDRVGWRSVGETMGRKCSQLSL